MPERMPVILIPSQLCTSAIWQHQINDLIDIADCHVANQQEDTSVEDIAVRILTDAPDHFSLAAHGMGGFVAFEIMRQAPERVSRLMLIGSIAAADAPAQIERRRGYEKLVKAGKFDQLIPERIPLLFHPDRETEPDLVDVAMMMARETGPEAFLCQQEAIIRRPDSRPMLATINCPVMVVCGRQDRLGTVETQQEISAAIPGSELCIVEDSGHYCMLEKPQDVAVLMRRWLSL